MIALLAALFLGTAHAADARAVASINTGMRPLGLPILSNAIGGGLRAGIVAGPLTPFAGGAFTMASGKEVGEFDPSPTRLHAATAQLGLRLRVVELEHAQTFLIAGGLLSSVGGRTIWDTAGGRGSGTKASLGPGGFLGGGADAFVSSRVSLGVEAGGAYIGGGLLSGNTDGSRFEGDEIVRGALLFSYTSLGVTVWMGGGA